MSRKLAIAGLIIVLAGLGIFIYKYRSNGNANEDVIRIGALVSLTGSSANYGKSLKQGIDIAVDEVNRGGGINGKKLEVIYEDSQGDAKTGISGFNKLVDVDKVPVVIGSISSVILAVEPIADEKKVILINSSAISPKICEKAEDFLFSVMVNGATEAKFMAGEISKKHQSEPIAILFSNNSSGVDTKDNFVKQLESNGGKVAVAEGYELNTTDFKPQLTKLKESKARVGYLIAFSSNEFANILTQSKEIGLNLQWYSYSGIETKETLDLAKNAAEGVIYSYPQYDPNDVAFDGFQNKYQSLYQSWADIYTVTSYDALKLLSSIMKNNGTASTAIQQGLRNVGGFKGVLGETKFTNKQCVEKPLMWKIVKDNKYQIFK
ncbi:MAG TPA: ABC transporter substrate-binding protein [Pyrinomonadaceae bacterium]|jgi:branched-chain amino acid transport system substrate-binding protein